MPFFIDVMPLYSFNNYLMDPLQNAGNTGEKTIGKNPSPLWNDAVCLQSVSFNL